MKKYLICRCLYVIFILLSQSVVSCVLAESQKCVVSDNQVNSIKIGDSVSKIFDEFKSGYTLKHQKRSNSAREIQVANKGENLFKFSIDSTGKIFLIYMYDCFTKENIGSGSTLRDALNAYGKGSIEPSEEGYYLTFPTLKGVLFLLDDRYIPKNLRGIPDDVFTEEDENKILAIGEITISLIQLTAEE